VGRNQILAKIKIMKTLILFRHAKTESVFEASNDFERNLLKIGEETARKVSNIFKENHIVPDVILCSTAHRTRQTCDIFVQNTNSQSPIVYLEELYMASASEILQLVKEYSNQYHKIMIIGHNDGISKLANRVSKNGCESLSTSALVVFDFKSNFDIDNGDIKLFINPKLI
jgi:phosphohistidine phosphatase